MSNYKKDITSSEMPTQETGYKKMEREEKRKVHEFKVSERQEFSDIPLLENELMWIVRVTDEPKPKELPSSDDSVTSK